MKGGKHVMIPSFPSAARVCAALLALAAFNPSSAQTPSVAAEAFPNRSVRLIVPMPPGSAPDIRARQIAQKLAEDWRQPVIVDNRPGATGSIAMEMAARSPADGHTLVLAGVQSMAILPHLTPLPFDPLKDFAPVTAVSAGPLVLVAHASMPFDDLDGMISQARANPGKLNAASSGTGGLAHLAVLLFNRTAGIEVTHIPYKGGSQTTADLISGQVQLMFDFAPVIAPHVKAGRLKALAVAAERRLAPLPDVPTFEERGYQGMRITGWQGILVPAGTAPELILKLNRSIAKALREPEVSESILSTGGEVGGNSSEQFAAFIRNEHAKWGKIISDARIRLE